MTAQPNGKRVVTLIASATEIVASLGCWERLAAVRSGRVVIADGNQYFNRPGPRLADSLEILAEVLHPDVFSYGYEGTGWIRYQEEGGA